MKCCNHFDRDSVSRCLDCGRGLCDECTNFYSMPICEHCNLMRANAVQSDILKNLFIMAVLFVFGFYLVYSDGKTIIEGLMTGYVLAGIPWGWSVLTMITPRVFLFMSVVGWLIYFVVKFSIAAFIGWIIMPFKLYQYVKRYIKAEKVKTNLPM